MKKFKRLSVVMVALTMCILLSITAWAANTNGVTYTATLDNSTICVSAEAQTVVLTVKANDPVVIGSIGATVDLPEGWTVASITHAEGTYADYNGTFLWFTEDAENITTDVIAIVTVAIPANAPSGTYEIGLKDLEISSDYGSNVWESGGTVSATLTICEQTGLKGDVNGDGLINSADLTVLARYVGGIEDITDATYLANADVNGDGLVNSADLTKHARYVGGIITDWSQN